MSLELQRLQSLAGIVTEGMNLSRVNAEANIHALLLEIKDLTGRIEAASLANAEKLKSGASTDKWGTQGNLAHVRQSLEDILQFIDQ